MSTVVLCSAAGAPGVTSTALGLALSWPSDVLLLDADRTPSQAILAGYLRGASSHGLGMTGLLQAHRERRPLLDALIEQSMPLPEPPVRRSRRPVEKPVVRRFVPGFAHLGSIDLFGAAWHELGMALASADFDVIVDAGRIGIHGLPQDLASTATRVAVVSRSSLASLAALRLYLGLVTDQVAHERVGVALVGPGRPYGPAEVAQQFGVNVLAEIAWDPSGAADLAEGHRLSARWHRRRLGASFAKVARGLHAELIADRERLEIPA